MSVSDLNPLPEWCGCNELGGNYPVQGEGVCYGHAWYFRARHERWGFQISSTGTLDDLFDDPSLVEYSRSFPYPGDRYSAGTMPLPEAREFIVRELTNWLRGIEFRVTVWLAAP